LSAELKNKEKRNPMHEKEVFPQSNFQKMMNRMSVWYRVRRSSVGFQTGLLLGLAAAMAFSLILITIGLGLRLGFGKSEFAKATIFSVLIGGIGFGVAAFLWPAPKIKIARFFDLIYELKDRTSTAVEILQSSQPISGGTGVLRKLQLEDAVLYGNRINPRVNFFLPISQMRWISAVFLIIGMILLISFGQPYFSLANQRQAIRQAIQDEIISLEELRQEINNNQQLTLDDRQNIDQILQETIHALGETETLEQAVAALTQAEDELRAREDAEVADQVQALQQLGSRLAQSEDPTGNPLEDVANELSEGDLMAAAQTIQEINVENLSNEERAALADQLAAAAESTSETNPELAESLSDASQALQNGDLQNAQEALSQAAGDIAQTGNQQALNEAIQQATVQTGQSAQLLIQTGLDQQLAQAANANPQDGAGQPGEGLNNGQGSGQSPSNQDGSGSASGAGQGSVDQGNISGSEADPDPIDQGNSPGDGTERSFEPLLNPQRLGGSGSMDVYLPPSGAPGEELLGLENSSPGEEGTSTVPYVQVYPAYAEAYRRVVESGAIPLSLRSIVRDYFSHLEP
jgi:hypothetical protein